MPIQDIQYSFSGGEVSELFTGRGDINRYQSALQLCENWVTLPKGGITTRDGTQYIATVKNAAQPCRLERFEFSVEQAYMFAFGPGVIEVFQDLAQLMDSGSPVEITTPYLAADLFSLQFAQSADVLFIVHPDYPPAKISRLSVTSFQYDVITFRPPPFFEQDTNLFAPLTLSAMTGTITLSAGANVYLEADVGRQVVAGTGRGVLTALVGTSPTFQATCLVVNDFSSLTFDAGFWALTGSPVAAITSDVSTPIGDVATLSLTRDQEDNPTLLSNGDFASGSTGWTDHSGALLASGTADTGTNDTTLVDTGADFIAAGVLPNHLVLDTTVSPNVRDVVVSLLAADTLALTSGGAALAATDTFEIRDTGVARFTNGEAQLEGGAQGVGWIEASFVTVIGRTYRVVFDVRRASLSFQVGSVSQASDLVAEATHPIGNDVAVTFTATSTLSFLQFRNNQNTTAVVDNVLARDESIMGFRAADVGKLVATKNGIVEITVIADGGRQASGIVWSVLDDTEQAALGTWVLGAPSWSAANGYPRALSFHQGRLWFGGTTQQPLTVWGSVVGLFENFSLGVLDDDAVDIEISANQMNTIEWLEPFQDLFVGTRGGIHLLTGGNNPITPSNKAQVPQDTEGSPPLRPVRIGDRLFHVARGRRQLRELTIVPDTGLTNVRDVTILADHVTRSGITQLTIQTEPYKILWMTRSDGQLAGYNFELSEEVSGWHRQVTLGEFESSKVLPIDEGTGEETQQVWMVAVRNGQRYIEVMRPTMETLTTRQARLTVDSAVRYDGAATTTFSGLDHLNGQTVNIVSREGVSVALPKGETKIVDRLVNLGTAVVSGGQVTSAVAAARADIGLSFLPKARTLHPEHELKSGGIFGRKVRWTALAAKVYETEGLSINGRRISQQTVDDVMDTYISPQTETVEGIGDGWSHDAGITITQDAPLPATLLALAGQLDIEEVE